MSWIIALLLMAGPPQPSGASMPLKIHLGRDHRSAVARSELGNMHEWFWEKRLKIEAGYRLIIDEDSLDCPTYQIGRGDDRHQFPAGAFVASGTFMLTLLSIAMVDQWERQLPENVVWVSQPDGNYEATRLQDDKPLVFPFVDNE